MNGDIVVGIRFSCVFDNVKMVFFEVIVILYIDVRFIFLFIVMLFIMVMVGFEYMNIVCSILISFMVLVVFFFLVYFVICFI